MERDPSAASRSNAVPVQPPTRLAPTNQFLPWLAGPAFSVADLNVAGALYRALSIDVSKWRNLDGWLHRCWDRPAAKHARALREQ
jgi:glutathione S-transferase